MRTSDSDSLRPLSPLRRFLASCFSAARTTWRESSPRQALLDRGGRPASKSSDELAQADRREVVAAPAPERVGQSGRMKSWTAEPARTEAGDTPAPSTRVSQPSREPAPRYTRSQPKQELGRRAWRRRAPAVRPLPARRLDRLRVARRRHERAELTSSSVSRPGAEERTRGGSRRTRPAARDRGEPWVASTFSPSGALVEGAAV